MSINAGVNQGFTEVTALLMWLLAFTHRYTPTCLKRVCPHTGVQRWQRGQEGDRGLFGFLMSSQEGEASLFASVPTRKGKEKVIKETI